MADDASRRAEPATPDEDTVAHVLSAAIEKSGVTLAHLRRRLAELGTPVSLTALSYWRSGQRQPGSEASRAALGNLEPILDLEAGALTGLVAAPRRSGAAAGNPAVPEWATATPIQAVLAGLGFGADRGLTDQSLQHVLDVDAAGCPSLLRVRALHRATRDGVDRRPVGLTIRHPDGEPRSIVALAGGRIGRAAEDLANGVYVAEFLFDRPLGIGETVAMEYQVTVAPGSEQSYELAIGPRLRHAMVWVRFHPDRLPKRVETYRHVRGRRFSREVDIAGTTSVHHAVDGGGSGRMGIRWSWNDVLPPVP